jgi:hypothetical protein
MRTKILLLTAALTVAGVATSMAQVYSQNIVGYVNVSVTQGVFKMIANPLNTTNNTIGSVLTPAAGVQDGDQYLEWTGSGYTTATYASFLGGWDQPNIAFAPGGGGFYLPSATTNLTFVGEVMTGDLSNPFPAGFSIVSSQVPQSGDADSLGLTPALADGDQVLTFDGTGFKTFTKAVFLGGWDTGNPPPLNVGESFFINPAGTGAWTRTFNP